MQERISKAVYFVLVVEAFVLPLLVGLKFYDPYLTLKYASVQITAAVIVGLWLIGFASGKVKRVLCPPVLISLFALTALSAISLAWAVNLYEGSTEIIQLTSYMTICFVTANIPHDRRLIRRILKGSVIGGVVVSMIGIVQALGVDISMLPQTSSPGSTFGYRNSAAQYLVLIIPVALYLALSGEQMATRILATVAGGVMLTHVVFSMTRAAWLGLSVACGIICAVQIIKQLRRRQGLIAVCRHFAVPALIIGLTCATAIVLVGARTVFKLQPQSNESGTSSGQGNLSNASANREKEAVLGRALSVTDTRDATIKTRIAFWRNTWELIKEHPLTGVGYGNFKIVYPAYSGRAVADLELTASQRITDAHNDYIQTLAETGILGVLLFLTTLTLAAIQIGRFLIRETEPDERALVLALSASLLAMAVIAIFSFPFKMPTAFYFWLWIALILNISNRGGTTRLPKMKSRRLTRASRISVPARYVKPLVILVAVAVVFAGGYWTFRQCAAKLYLASSFSSAMEHDWHHAAEEIAVASELASDDFRITFMRGVIEDQNGSRQSAIIWYRRTLTLNPYDLQALNDLGAAYAETGRFTEAMEYLQRAVTLYPRFAVCHKNIGDIHFLQGDLAAAIVCYKRAAALRSDIPEIYYSLGAAYYKQRLWQDAMEQFEKALALDPHNRDASYWLAQCRQQINIQK